MAKLVGEPWQLRPWEIARLTDRQIVDVYFHPRDEDGRLIEPGEDASLTEEMTPEEGLRVMRRMMKAFDVDPSEIRRADRGE